MQPLASFLASVLGQRVTALGGDGGQCVDLINLYLPAVRDQAEVHANAVDWASIKVPGLTWVRNSPSNYPHTGAIVVWGAWAPEGIGGFGHIAINLTADKDRLITVDQNWPDGSPVGVHVHDYGGVVGWHQP